MDVFTRDDLNSLVHPDSQPCVSIYMPTHRTGREIREDSLRCKNLLSQAEEDLCNRGLRSSEAHGLLEPAWQVQGDGNFWKAQSDGLAMFVARGTFRYFRVPLNFEELSAVNTRFHVTGMLPLLQNDGQFYLLAVSQKHIRFFTGTHYNISRLESDRLPENLRDALRIDEFVTSLQQHSYTSMGVGSAGSAETVFHGQGGGDLGSKKNEELREYFRRIDDGLREFLGDAHAPLVFAGVEYLFPLFKESCSYRRLLETPVRGNPDKLSEKQLHQKAWELAEAQLRKAQAHAVENYGNAISSGLATTEADRIVPAAFQGRVGTLFVARQRHMWGTFDEASASVQFRAEREPDADDLLDFAAIHTLLHRGSVYVLEADRMPAQEQPIAAILRYSA